MNIEKHIAYWRAGSEEDFQVAQELREKRRFRHALFFAHLAVEKMLKAHVVRVSQDVPPKIRDLVALGEKAGLPLAEPQIDLLRELNMYQLEGRYPGEDLPPIDLRTAQNDMARTAEILRWLKDQLLT